MVRALTFRKLVGAHSALTVRFDNGYAFFPEARKTQRLQDRRVNFLADDNFDGRSAKHSVVNDVPSGFRQQGITRGGKRGEVGHGGAGYQPALAFRGQTQERRKPSARTTSSSSAATGDITRRRHVLIPGVCEPTCRHRRRQRAANDETEVATPVEATVAGEPISSSMAITSAGSVERSGNGSWNCESAARSFSPGATRRSATLCDVVARPF